MLPNREGWNVGKYLVERIYREEGLTLRQRRKRHRRVPEGIDFQSPEPVPRRAQITWLKDPSLGPFDAPMSRRHAGLRRLQSGKNLEGTFRCAPPKPRRGP